MTSRSASTDTGRASRIHEAKLLSSRSCSNRATASDQMGEICSNIVLVDRKQGVHKGLLRGHNATKTYYGTTSAREVSRILTGRLFRRSMGYSRPLLLLLPRQGVTALNVIHTLSTTKRTSWSGLHGRHRLKQGFCRSTGCPHVQIGGPSRFREGYPQWKNCPNRPLAGFLLFRNDVNNEKCPSHRPFGRAAAELSTDFSTGNLRKNIVLDITPYCGDRSVSVSARSVIIGKP